MKKKILCLTLGAFLLSAPLAWAEDSAQKLTLDESIRLALENNLNIHLADKNIQIAKKDYTAAKNARWGGATINNSYTDYENGNEIYADGVNVSIPLYSGGKLEAQQKAQKYSWENSKKTFQRTVEATIYDTQDGYYSVLRCERLVNVAEEYLTRMRSHLKVAKAKFTNGMVAKIDVLNAEVEVSKAEQQLIESKNELDISKSKFNNILNRPLSTPFEVVDNLESSSYAYGDKTLEQLIAKAYENRQEIKIAENNVKIAEQNVKKERAEFIPTLDLNGGYNWESNDKFFDNGSWKVGLSSTFSLSPATKSSIDSAKIAVEKAKVALEQQQQDIALEVRQAYLNVVRAEKVLATCKTTVKQAKESDKIAEVRYREGVGTSTERIDAQNELTNAETNYANALYNLNLTRAALEKALGQDVAVK